MSVKRASVCVWDRFVEHHAPLMVARFNAACPTLKLSGCPPRPVDPQAELSAICPPGLDQLKVQVNTGGGGCFPMHYDTSSGVKPHPQPFQP